MSSSSRGKPQDRSAWKTVKLGSVLRRVRKPVDVEADKTYREIGIYSHSRGIFHKEERTGASLGSKRVFWVVPNCFVVNIVFAWEQAIAKTTSAETGMIASHRFPMYKPVRGRLDLDYLVYYFKTPRGKYLLGLASPGGAGRNKTLGQQAFLDLEIPLPTFSEQRRIANILRTWDEAIALTQQLIDATQRRKQGLMQQLLTGRRQFSEFCQEWSQTNLSALVKSANGVLTDGDWVESKDQDPNGNVRLVQLADIGDGSFLNRSQKYLTAQKANELKCTYIKEGDILLARMPDPLGRACIFPKLDCPAVTAVDVCIIRVNAQVDRQWLMHAINSSRFRKEIGRRSSGTTRVRISRRNLAKIALRVPVLPEQSRIADVLTTCGDEADLLEQKLKALQRQKKGLMQQLLTGRVRVEV